MEATEVLLIILGATLFIFLLLAITFVAYMIIVIRRIDSITEKAEGAASSFYEFSRHLKSTATPTVVSGAILSVVKKFMKSRKGKSDEQK